MFSDHRDDGFTYAYADDITVADSMQEAARLIGRNRSTINAYTKNPKFPAINSNGGWSFDIIAAQDWILLNTDHHSGLEPFWPDLPEPNAVITVATDAIDSDDAEFTLHH